MEDTKRQLQQLESDIREIKNLVKDMSYKINEINRTSNSNDINIKEIMRGMAIIYNSVDELEPRLISERETK